VSRSTPNPPSIVATPSSSSQPAITVLLIEDNPADALLIQAMLAEPSSARFEVGHAPTLAKGLECLAKFNHDVVLLDLSLPDSFGLETFDVVRGQAPAMPILVMSGLDDENAAVSAVHAGAQDYLVKGSVDSHLLARSVRYAIERKRTEEALRQSEAFYQSLVENLPQFILRKDLQGKFTFGNQKFLAELGRPLSELVGKTDFDFFPPDLAEKYQQDDRAVMQTGQVFETVEAHEPPGDGGTRHMHVVKTPIRDRDGKVIGIQGIFWDVTEQRQSEDNLRKAIAQLAENREELLRTVADLRDKHNEVREAQVQIIDMERMQTVGRLATGVAHEVKTPLSVLRLGLDYLAGLPALREGDAPKFLIEMNDALQRADTILVGLREFAAPSKTELKPEALNALVEESLGLVSHEFKKATYQITREFDPALPPALVDRGKIKIVFVNLLSNALRSMPEGGPITIRTRPKEATAGEGEVPAGGGAAPRTPPQAVLVEIEDSGMGIPPEKISRIFDPFFTVKPGGKGKGFGLTVTKRIVELHGGSIAVQNWREGGVRATVTLKASPPRP
jgi:PAS domain S-box-containing protein